ncbi:MAG: DUF1801 domain-containing protein [Thermoleophilia bacterium]|nr:DUF1801 domain-containing protein [Thermoleophilia bacterium]
MPPDVAAVFASWPSDVRTRLETVRALVFAVAAERGVGPLTEMLKWGEPAYLTEATGAGATIRLGQVKGRAGGAVLFNCRTTLIEGFRRDFDGVFTFDGNRALILGTSDDLDEDALALCIGQALTYHQARRKKPE